MSLPPRDAYRLWAPVYERENGMTVLDSLAVERLSPPTWRLLLDAGCGTGRRLPAERAVGVDLVVEMLAAGQRRGRVAAGDLLGLPFPPAAFDLIWCRLAVGHVADLGAFYAALAAVAAGGATLVVTDFHPDAARRPDWRRDFTGVDGRRHAVAHHVHEVHAHEAAAARAGWALDRVETLAVGPEIRRFFEEAGEAGRYETERGEPVLLALRCRRAP